MKTGNEKNSKTATDLKDLHARVRGFDNYHFLTRSTESITRLTSSLARLRVSKRIMPLLFIMAAITEYKSPDEPYMDGGGKGPESRQQNGLCLDYCSFVVNPKTRLCFS